MVRCSQVGGANHTIPVRRLARVTWASRGSTCIGYICKYRVRLLSGWRLWGNRDGRDQPPVAAAHPEGAAGRELDSGPSRYPLRRRDRACTAPIGPVPSRPPRSSPGSSRGPRSTAGARTTGARCAGSRGGVCRYGYCGRARYWPRWASRWLAISLGRTGRAADGHSLTAYVGVAALLRVALFLVVGCPTSGRARQMAA